MRGRPRSRSRGPSVPRRAASRSRARDVRGRVRRIQSDEADEVCDTRHFDGPETEPLSFHARNDPVDPDIGLLARARPREVLHHFRVRVERREWRAVVGAPRTQEQPRGSERRDRRHRPDDSQSAERELAATSAATCALSPIAPAMIADLRIRIHKRPTNQTPSTAVRPSWCAMDPPGPRTGIFNQE